uniref:RagB/SusD family nutrient uptake outer membrane protein n=1 Tax=Hallella colorans TaxID=1703337 RepID=UPI00248D92AB
EQFNFAWVDQPEEMNDIRMVGTLVMGLYNEKQVDEAGLERLFPREKNQHSSDLFIVNKDGQDIFKTISGMDESTTDIRSTRLVYEPKGSYRNFLSTKWYVKERNTMERDRTVTILPLLRTSELRYIVAECMARKGDFEGAYGLLNTMREHRGLNDYKLPTQTSWGTFVKDLVREGQREWISEGQLFYLYKRLNAGVKRDNGTVKPLTKQESVLPIPAEETK